MSISNLPEVLLKQLLKVITSVLSVHSIYSIGVRSHQLKRFYSFNGLEKNVVEEHWEVTLLIVSKSYVKDPKAFMEKIFTKMNKKVRLYSLHYTYNEITTRLNEGDNFLSRLLLPENRILQEHPLVITGYIKHPVMYKRIRNGWEFKISKAAYFISKLKVSDDISCEPAKLLLVHQAISQVCAALLWVYWEYKPSHVDLNYLVRLCQNFSKSTAIVLPKESFRSKRIYNAICHAPYNLNYKVENDSSIEDGDYGVKLAFLFF
ncbi:hypothetical protein ACFSO9_07300 [Mesonia maritima]|uniref:hypothetical protein n=1 Tax=Mesonia maritima TaxID=1793873 RepID=UPI0036388614